MFFFFLHTCPETDIGSQSMQGVAHLSPKAGRERLQLICNPRQDKCNGKWTEVLKMAKVSRCLHADVFLDIVMSLY